MFFPMSDLTSTVSGLQMSDRIFSGDEDDKQTLFRNIDRCCVLGARRLQRRLHLLAAAAASTGIRG